MLEYHYIVWVSKPVARVGVLVVRAVLNFFLLCNEVELVRYVFVAGLLLALRHVFADELALRKYFIGSLVMLTIWTLKPWHD
jgi:hypothetical protein